MTVCGPFLPHAHGAATDVVRHPRRGWSRVANASSPCDPCMGRMRSAIGERRATAVPRRPILRTWSPIPAGMDCIPFGLGPEDGTAYSRAWPPDGTAYRSGLATRWEGHRLDV